jgi:hypothetical protein
MVNHDMKMCINTETNLKSNFQKGEIIELRNFVYKMFVNVFLLLLDFLIKLNTVVQFDIAYNSL